MSLQHRSKFLIIGLSLLLGMYFVNSANAQDFDELGLAIRPAIIDVGGEPGQTITTEISIENISEDVTGVSVGSRSLLPNDPEIDQSRRGDFDASQWVQPREDSTLLERGQQKTITVDIEIPATAGPGGHYALVTYRAVNANASTSDSSNSIANPELTSILLITVSGLIDERVDGQLEQPSTIQLNRSIDISSRVLNVGNIHVLSGAQFQIKDSSGNVLETIRRTNQLVLPNTIKELPAEWDPKGRIGKHSVDVMLTYGSPQQEILLTSETFWVMPPLTSIFLTVSLIAFVIFSVATGKHWPRATLRLLGAPLRLGKESSLKESTTVKTDALDELGADKSIPTQKRIRDIQPVNQPKQPKTKTILDESEASKMKRKDYLKKLKRK